MSLCLSFIQAAAATQATLPPPNIQQLLQNRIAHQWRQRGHSEADLRFDDATCANFGDYRYTERSILLTADVDEWRGPLEISLSSALEGERIPFETVSKESRRADYRPLSLPERREQKSEWKKWLPWTLAIVGVGVATYFVVEREQHIRELRRGMEIRF
jgi:hypothetical protein